MKILLGGIDPWFGRLDNEPIGMDHPHHNRSSRNSNSHNASSKLIDYCDISPSKICFLDISRIWQQIRSITSFFTAKLEIFTQVSKYNTHVYTHTIVVLLHERKNRMYSGETTIHSSLIEKSISMMFWWRQTDVQLKGNASMITFQHVHFSEAPAPKEKEYVSDKTEIASWATQGRRLQTWVVFGCCIVYFSLKITDDVVEWTNILATCF